MSCIYSGEFTLTVTKEEADKIEELFNHSILEGALPQAFYREAIKDEGEDADEYDMVKIDLCLNAEECGRWLEEGLEDFFKEVYKICYDYPSGFVLQYDDDTTYRLEFDDNTGRLSSETADWLLRYPNWLNRLLQDKAEELLEQL